MALQPGARTPLLLDVSDRVIGETHLKQRARFCELHHSQAPDGTCQATILLEVAMYATEVEGYGPELIGAGFARRPVRLVADNNTLVEVPSGRLLAIYAGESAEVWQAKLDALSQDRTTMLQGDFFEYLRENQPIPIGAMIRDYIQQADAAGKFA